MSNVFNLHGVMTKNIIIIILVLLFIIVAVALEASLHDARYERDALERMVKLYEQQLGLQRQRVDEAIRVFSERERESAERKAAVKEVESNNPDWASAYVPADVAILCNDLCSPRSSAD